VTYIVQYENSAAFQNVEGFVHLEVSVDRNACTDHHLLGPQGEIVGACGGADFDEDVAMVTKMNEMLALGGAERISLPRCGLSLDDALHQHLAHAEAPKLKRKDRRLWSNTFMAISSEVHRSFFRRWLCDERLNCSDHRRWRKLVMTPEFTIEYVTQKVPCSNAWSANEDVTRTAPGRVSGK